MSDPRSALPGRKPGDRRVRVERPHAQYFRYAGPGTLVARPKAHEPRGVAGRIAARARRIVVGRPLATEEEIDERLSKKKALAIFSSDAISSSAYATEEILRVLVLGGATLIALSLPTSIAIAVLLAIVAFSYRQVCLAYPSGGGSYSVSKANLGRLASLVAASALLIDYTLTVAVSVSSAVEQIGSALPFLEGQHVTLAVGAIALVTLGNLRGLRESGNIFAVPTYLFVGSALLMIAMGVYRVLTEGADAAAPATTLGPDALTSAALLVLLLRAFASGAVALTGTEAIATGVPAFRPPEARNAATTLMVMAGLLATLFIGITFLAVTLGAQPSPQQTILAQVSSAVYGPGSIGFYLFQSFTALLLILAANTSFAAFPRLAAVLSQDSYFPRQFSFRGDRLAFTMGIVALGVVAATLVVGFGADTHALIPLYAVGVFIDFTISQSGMVRHWLRERTPGWRYRLSVNTFGALLTGIIAVVVTAAKAPTSLLVLALIPLLVALMLFIHREYRQVRAELALRPDQVIRPPHKRERVIVPVPGLSRAVVQAVNFARAISDDVRAVHVTYDMENAAPFRETWEQQVPGVPLVIVESPYRSLTLPFLAYLDVMAPSEPDTITVVVLPEYVPRHWWDGVLYNQNANRLRKALLGRPDTVVANVPYRRERPVAGPQPARRP
ncbi:MAG TPA: APC family permease [Candidatus Caenarcaniphilales bacterium]|nr:APC family permease [Candidatus Caenarcaniphilales bacterium]